MSPVWEGLAQRLEGKLVVLEPLAPEHADGLRRAAADPAVWSLMTVHGHQADVFDEWFEWTLANAAAGIEAPFAIILRESGEPVGSSRYMTLRPEHRGLEIGWTWHTPRVWGTGVNVDAKRLLLAHAFEDLGCLRVEFKTDASNERSRATVSAATRRTTRSPTTSGRRCARTSSGGSSPGSSASPRQPGVELGAEFRRRGRDHA